MKCFLDHKLAITCSFVGGRIIVEQEKFSKSERSWMIQFNALQEATRSSIIKFYIYCLSVWFEFFVHYALTVEMYYQHVLHAGPFEFRFFFCREKFSPIHLKFCRFVSGSYAKHQVSFPVISLLRKKLSASVIAITSWQHDTPSSLCSGVKECGTKRAHNFLFPKPSFRIRRTTVLGMFKDSIILDAILR